MFRLYEWTFSATVEVVTAALLLLAIIVVSLGA
jgi:hypothetical protein